MAKVKIFLDPDETIEQAQESLYKALDVHISAGAISELYEDDLANAMLEEVDQDVKEIFKKMYAEIGQVLADDIYRAKK